MEVGIIGLGKMGSNLAFNLRDQGYDVKGMDVSEEALIAAEKEGVATFQTVDELMASFKGKRVIWLMLPAGNLTENVLDYILPLLVPHDIVIEGGNSNYKDSIRRAEKFAEKEISYFDCGTSGGVSGARNDACLMIGGDKDVFTSIEQIFKDIAIESGYLYAGGSGSGHFLKMVHNGIEYGMMQAIGEGFQIVEKVITILI